MAEKKPARLVARDFMHRGVLTAYQRSNVSQAVRIMAENDVGSVVVLNDVGPCGVFTERDLLSSVLAEHRDPEQTQIAEVKLSQIAKLEPTASPEAAALALIRKSSRLLVFEGTELAGIITATDILMAIQKLNKNFEISRVITRKTVTVLPETPVDAVVSEMSRRRIGSVIVAKDDGTAVGIFTERDLIKRVVAPKRGLKTEVKGVMSSPLITFGFDTSGRKATEIMTSHRIKRLPLFSEGKLVGMVTARDVVEAFAGIHP